MSTFEVFVLKNNTPSTVACELGPLYSYYYIHMKALYEIH